MVYYCNKCGECCRNLLGVELYKELDRGDGVCKFLNENLCSIYHKRPLLCRIDEGYIFFKDIITKEEYYQKNKAICKMFQSKKK